MKDDFRDRSHLSTVTGDRQETGPRPGRRTAMQDAEQVQCWQCIKDTGVATSATVEITMAPRRKPDGKKTGGTKAHACIYCLSRGKTTILIE